MKTFLVSLVFVVVIVAGGYHYRPHSYKHTGPVTIVLRLGRDRLWLQRPNKEVFEMWFDNPPPFPLGLQLTDLTYTDDSKDERHFVSAVTQ